MISSAELGTRQLAMLVEAAERIARLPAIVTQDWCASAAEHLVRLRTGSVCIVTVGREIREASGKQSGFEVDITGGASSVRTIGESSLSAVHVGGSKSIGWSFSDAVTGHFLTTMGSMGVDARVARLRDLPSWSSWPITTAGKRWSRIGITELLVGRIAIEPGDQARVVYIEMGLPRDQSTFTRVEAILLGSLLESLRARAFAAFGPSRGTDLQRITRREQAVLEQLTLGRTVREIAERLERSPHTVHDHVKALHRKLKANSRGELIARYLGFTSDSMTSNTETVDALESDSFTRNGGSSAPSARISGEVTSGY